MTVKPVHEEPEVTVFAWHFVREALDGTYRLVGYRVDSKRGRISSTISEFDMASRTVTTFSGRVYHLRGDQDPVHAAHIVRRHAELCGLNEDAVALVDVEEVALAYAPWLPSDRFN